MSGEISQSTALAEAQEDSLTELFSRDPEGFQRQDRNRIVEALRAQREKWMIAEAAGAALPKAKKAPNLLTRVAGTAEEIGL